jgi:CRISPR/Cas system-associated exonuclease Cas4 (RecB family)
VTSSYIPGEAEALRISKSSLMTYMMCPRQFYWRYVADIPRAPPTEEAIRGGQVHEVMEFGLLEGPESAVVKAEELGVENDPAVDALTLLIHQIAHDMDGFEVIEAEVKHMIPETYEDGEIMWVGLIDGLVKFGTGEIAIVELKTGKMNTGKLTRTRKELLYYKRMISLMDGYEEPTHFLYISPDYESGEFHNPNDKLLQEGNKRGKTLWLGPEQGIAIMEPIGKRSINAFEKSLSDTIAQLRLQQWPMNWNEYFCPLWCDFCLSCEAELTGDIEEGEYL